MRSPGLREKYGASCAHPMFLPFSMWQYFSSTPFLVATTILTWFKWRLASVQPLCPFILFGHPFLPTNVPWFKNKTVNLDLLPPKTRLPGAGFVLKNLKSPRSIWRWYMHRFLLLFLHADLVRGVKLQTTRNCTSSSTTPLAIMGKVLQLIEKNLFFSGVLTGHLYLFSV